MFEKENEEFKRGYLEGYRYAIEQFSELCHKEINELVKEVREELKPSN